MLGAERRLLRGVVDGGAVEDRIGRGTVVAETVQCAGGATVEVAGFGAIIDIQCLRAIPLGILRERR